MTKTCPLCNYIWNDITELSVWWDELCPQCHQVKYSSFYGSNRMDDKWYGITYPVPVWLQREWFWRLWARFMCPHGWHLLDEYQSLENHGLLCDACLLDVPLEQVIE